MCRFAKATYLYHNHSGKKMLKDEMMMIFFFLSISVPWHYRRKNFAQARRSSHVYESIDFNVFKCAQGINLEASKYSPPFSEKKTSPPPSLLKKNRNDLLWQFFRSKCSIPSSAIAFIFWV